MIQRVFSDRTSRMSVFLARVELHGVDCTPIVEGAPSPYRALSRALAQRDADLVVVGQRPGAVPRMSTRLMRECEVPLLQVRLADFPLTRWQALKDRWFAEEEFAFN